ncbi:MAG: L-glutamate gamma-semialdehyde dehydrogenase, partial [Acetobacteraceae bacterium]|nr:L-glutamate gamma-semialdehyde dehydrogenase [Acetobacteraceae bacterium]
RNPADPADRVGEVRDATPEDVAAAIARAEAARSDWGRTPADIRAECLLRAADAMEECRLDLVGLIAREAGRTLPNAISEIREAVDFLRYYAAESRDRSCSETPLGPVACISPWNFPLAIFTGQIAAALAAGNPVLAKPAEETPLIAAEAVRILHAAGIPRDALQLLPGSGETGALLVADPRIAGVAFTGSTAAARAIARQLAERLGPDGRPVPLIAETGGQNALVADSSALAEQVVADVLTSAFDSAGQRCSALRVLCLQEDVADRTLPMLKGAMDELALGDPRRLATDIGPVISAEAARTITAHVDAMRAAGRAVHGPALLPDCTRGNFVAPAVIEIESLGELSEEVFGPVLHVLRWRRDTLDALIDSINGTGYGLTFGLQTRLDDTTEQVLTRAKAGNIYVNRNMIGAVVGAQPFGGHGLSGTGPKAGGPLYLRRFVTNAAQLPPALAGKPPVAFAAWRQFLAASGADDAAADAAACAELTPLGAQIDLPGPVGERNTYRLEPRGTVLCMAASEAGLLRQVSAALCTGNRPLILGELPASLGSPPPSLRDLLGTTTDLRVAAFEAALFDGAPADLLTLCPALAAREGAIIPVHAPERDAEPGRSYRLEWLVREKTISINTAAMGGNASLMALEEDDPV